MSAVLQEMAPTSRVQWLGDLTGTELRSDGWYRFPRNDPFAPKYRAVSSILSVIAMPALMNWYARCEREECADAWAEFRKNPGRDATRELDAFLTAPMKVRSPAGERARDHKGEIGTAAHQAIAQYVRHYVGDTDLRHEPDVETMPEARAYFESFTHWHRHHRPEWVCLEAPIFHRTRGYAGTMDGVCLLDGHMTIIDYKSSSRVRGTHLMQLAAYFFAPEVWTRDDRLHEWQEHDIQITRAAVVHLHPNGKPATMHYVENLQNEYETFLQAAMLEQMLREKGGLR